MLLALRPPSPHQRRLQQLPDLIASLYGLREERALSSLAQPFAQEPDTEEPTASVGPSANENELNQRVEKPSLALLHHDMQHHFLFVPNTLMWENYQENIQKH